MTTRKTKRADKLKIEGVAGFEGEYDLDQSAITKGDARVIKRIAGVRLGELDEAARAGDLDVLVALTMIAMRHAGHPHWEHFDEATDDVPLEVLKITYIGGDDAADPQTREPEPG